MLGELSAKTYAASRLLASLVLAGSCLFSSRRLRVAQFSHSVGSLSLRMRKMVNQDFASHTSDLSVEAQGQRLDAIIRLVYHCLSSASSSGQVPRFRLCSWMESQQAPIRMSRAGG